MPADSDQVVAVDDLVRRYGEREALAGVSLTVGPGKTLVVFGPNGAGKTTLLRVLATLLMPHGGVVRVLGHELPDEAQPVRAQIGLVAHNPLLYHGLSGRENLRFYARLYELADADQRIAELLDATAMSERADDPLRELSRGMVQRLAVCRAVLHRPRLLLLDEPYAGLDPEAAALVEPLIGRASSATRILVTHDLEQGLDQADHVIGLRDGLVALDRPGPTVTEHQARNLYARAQL